MVMDADTDLTPDLNEVSEPEQAMGIVDSTLEKFLDAASVDMVFGKPIKYGNTFIIPSAELVAALGFGVGAGKFEGTKGQQEEGEEDKEKQGEEVKKVRSGNTGGGGGGGRVFSRPVAVIVASPDGVVIKPIVDTTKIALAALTAAGFMFGVLSRMRRGPRY
jgi:uncharacterized spore protein YtfJ